MPEVPTLQTETDEQLAFLMLNGPVQHILKNKGESSSVELFLRAHRLLSPDIREIAGSAMRVAVVNHINTLRSDENSTRRLAGRMFGVKKKKKNWHPARIAEIATLKEKADPDSFTELALLADLQAAEGRMDEAKATYTKAMEAARRGGQQVIQ